MKFEIIEVNAYSGHQVNERPLSFRFQQREHKVAEVIDRWYEGGRDPQTPYLSYFKVRTTQDEEYILRYNGLFDSWQIMVG